MKRKAAVIISALLLVTFHSLGAAEPTDTAPVTTEIKPDAVVSTDGSGTFTTVQAALADPTRLQRALILAFYGLANSILMLLIIVHVG